MAHPSDDTDNEAPSPVARRGGNADSSDDDGVAPVEGAPAAAAAAPGAEGVATDVPMTDAGEGAGGAEKKEPEREVHSWRIPLQKWRNENRDREYSPEFKLDGENWRILVFPKGNPNHSVPGCMAAYLELRSERAYYSSVCHFKMQMAHPTEPNKYAWRDSTHTFTNTEVDRGFNDLLTPANLAEYTHDDGCVVLNVQAYKAPPGFQMRTSSYENYTPYDSKSSTGFWSARHETNSDGQGAMQERADFADCFCICLCSVSPQRPSESGRHLLHELDASGSVLAPQVPRSCVPDPLRGR